MGTLVTPLAGSERNDFFLHRLSIATIDAIEHVFNGVTRTWRGDLSLS
jgi:hypothetical protein